MKKENLVLGLLPLPVLHSSSLKMGTLNKRQLFIMMQAQALHYNLFLSAYLSF
jgi:hypothetical protein